MDKTVIEFVY